MTLQRKHNDYLLDYSKFNEETAFNKINAGRMLTCLVLAETLPSKTLPYNPFSIITLKILRKMLSDDIVNTINIKKKN